MSLLIAETRMPTAGLSWLYIGYRIQDTGYRMCPTTIQQETTPMGKWLHVMTSHPAINPAQ